MTIANVLAPQGPYAGIFGSEVIRTQQTAAPLLSALGLMPSDLRILPGLNEINAGIFEDLPQISPAGVLYVLGPAAWSFGFPLMPLPAPGSPDFNGIVFNRGFTGAVHTIYDTALAAGNSRAVAYSSSFTLLVGTMMNVDNPDLAVILAHPILPNTGTVVWQGDPGGGWTLNSWDGVPVGPPSLPTELFVDVRNLITAPQYATYDISLALLSGNPVGIVNALGDGLDRVGAAVVNFPFAVARDLVDA